MSNANVLSFPRRKPMAWEELPEHWSSTDRYRYCNLVESGEMTHDRAFADCEWHVSMRRRPDEGESEFLLRYAQGALARAPRKRQRWE